MWALVACREGREGRGGEKWGGEGRGGEGRSGEERGKEGRGEVGRRGEKWGGEGRSGEERGEVGRRWERREGASNRPGVREGSLQYALYVKYIGTYVKWLTTIYYSWLQPTCVNALNSAQ